MADMIARQNISGPDGGILEVDDLRPANQREGSSNQPPAEMREKSLHGCMWVFADMRRYPAQEDWDSSVSSPN